jgi:hypothetical protein
MTTRTPNLKLIISDELTSEARQNLERLDALGAQFTTTTIGSTRIRSRIDIEIEPNSSDIGGSGVGGDIRIGRNDHTIGDLSVYASRTSIMGAGELRFRDSDNSHYVGLRAPAVVSTSTQFILPNGDGTSGQILATDGAGQWYWVNNLASTGGQTLAVTWSIAEGISKSITHGFNTTDIDVSVYDNQQQAFVTINTVIYNNNNQLTLTSVEPPPSAGYRVYLKEV